MSGNLRSRGGLGLAVAVTAALVAALLPGTMSTATAKPPPKPGNVTGLALQATKPGAAYRVESTWQAANNATTYRVTMTDGAGVQLAQDNVTATTFTGAAARPAGSTVTVSVVPFNGPRRGRAATRSIVLPDLTAPVAAYTVTPQMSPNGDVTIEVNSISDDLSTDAQITQAVDWADGSPTVDADGTVTSFAHGYGATQAVYYPVVTVADLVGNTRVYELTVVVDDVTAPTGTFSVSPLNAWARWTQVTLTQIEIQDDLSQDDKISRTVDWGDGTTLPWTTGATSTHRYLTGANVSPTVTVTDEAGNQSDPLSTSVVTVTVDSVAPRVRLTPPKLRVHSVRSWKTLKGRSYDSGTGVRKVRLRAIEKRGSVWYSYKPLRQTWVRGGTTRAAAWAKTGAAKVSPTTARTWSVKLRYLKKGLLVYKVSSKDNVGNVSAWKLRKQLLTRY